MPCGVAVDAKGQDKIGPLMTKHVALCIVFVIHIPVCQLKELVSSYSTLM
jgi:hypothetical protein